MQCLIGTGLIGRLKTGELTADDHCAPHNSFIMQNEDEGINFCVIERVRHSMLKWFSHVERIAEN